MNHGAHGAHGAMACCSRLSLFSKDSEARLFTVRSRCSWALAHLGTLVNPKSIIFIGFKQELFHGF